MMHYETPQLGFAGTLEVQLRTTFQDTWANAVEADARLLSPGLKFGGGSQELREFYIALGELGAQAEGRIHPDHR